MFCVELFDDTDMANDSVQRKYKDLLRDWSISGERLTLDKSAKRKSPMVTWVRSEDSL